MFRKSVTMVAAGLMLFAAAASASAGGWEKLEGGMTNGERAAFTVEDAGGGIRISGQGSYDSAGGSAAGIVLAEAVDAGSFKTTLKVDEIAGLRNAGADHWFNFNLLNTPKFFSLDNAGQSQGLVVLMRPYDKGQIEVETYLLTPGSGFMGLGASTVTWDDKIDIQWQWSGDDGALSINGQAIEADFSKIPSDLFAGSKAYFSTGASAQGDAKFSYTVLSVNGGAASLAGVSNGSSAGGAPTPEANPKTGDSGVGAYVWLAVAAAAGLGAIALTTARRKKTA